MLLKAGIALMSAALLMAVGAAFYVFLQPDEPVVAATKAAEKTPEPTLEYGEPQRVLPEETKAPEVKAEVASAEPAPEPNPEVAAKSEPQPEPPPKSKPAPEPKPEPSSESKYEPKPEPRQTTPQGWSVPDDGQIQEANGPRRYGLTAGAVMGLTIKAIGLYDVPVFSSSETWALDSGVRHVPETSMPWSGGAQRNVYLEGHRLGYGGTGSYLVFYNLDRLGKGDEILLKNRAGQRYTYRVSDAFVVNPSDSWVMGQIRGRDMVTLQTCTGPGYSQRLIVRADRV